MYKLIKRVARTVLSEIWMNYQYLFRRKQVRLSKTKTNIILFGIPNHPNLGDQAIVSAERQFIADNFPNINLVMIDETDTASFLWGVKMAATSHDLVMYHGGGNIGSLYPLSERNRRFLIKKLKQQRVVIFPQSIFFEDNMVGKYEQRMSSRIYNNHPKLVLTVRENYSLERSQAIFSTVKCVLTPDIVFSMIDTLDSSSVHKPFRKILLVLRGDDESCLTAQFKAELAAALDDRFKLVKKTDTMAGEPTNTIVINDNNRARLLAEKLAEFAWADLVVTDRLHGTLFSILTGRPCLVFANNNHKIESTISTWLQGARHIKLINRYSVQVIEKSISELEHQSQDNLHEVKQKYGSLKKAIQGQL
ncbi:hypothetical protein EFP00_06700 [Lactiplantibacillus paraplantarum]|uniref:polysaccharide pyruvyl transferase family protein n=1 Tax=Lactiplantibacillus paraplantarum TaxID=60520 RepID=UPI0021A41004|nr:polysaccharide pyruvyl transferase family protein [Lactiplantibacillus paraplantarum]MCT4457123.1 hypothetical protein [Lactiplantibacillus paraplantarum]